MPPIRIVEHDSGVPTRSAEHGFTLVEVMVALLIFGMIAAAGVAILSFSVRAQSAIGTRLDDDSALARTASILSADFAQAVNRPARDETGTPRPAFIGERGTATPIVTLSRLGWSNIDGAPRGTVQRVAYRLADGRLERIGWPLVDGAQPLAPATLIDRIAEVRIRYRYAGAWSDRWDGADGIALPDAVELVLVRSGGVAWRQMFLVGTGYRPPSPQASPTPS
jgi:general secretion pathway protein J